MQNQSSSERFPLPLALAAIGALGAPAIFFTLGGAALFLYLVSLPIPLFVFWLSWGVTEPVLAPVPVVRPQATRAYAA